MAAQTRNGSDSYNESPDCIAVGAFVGRGEGGIRTLGTL